VANITGDGTAVIVTLAIIPVTTTDATVTGGGLGTINLSGVEAANVANARARSRYKVKMATIRCWSGRRTC
jgi:hypothetical protein